MEGDEQNFEETLRAIMGEVAKHIERAAESVDVDEIAGSVGVDPAMAREWAQNAGSWLRARTEMFGDELARRQGGGGERPQAAADPFSEAGPHPLDLPTDEQGLALAALESGRWVIEPGTEALTSKGDGPGPSDALGLVRELRVRDWISMSGELTLVGRDALARWLELASRR